MAQSVERPTSAQVMISQSVSLSPALGSVLTAQTLELALDSVCPSLSVPPLLMLCLFLFQKRINIKNNFFNKKNKKENTRMPARCDHVRPPCPQEW